MDTLYLLICIASMSLTTYLIRALPMVVFRKKITNIRIRSFLFYVPYTVLAAMTFPSIFSSTGSLISGIAGCITALVLSYFRRGLLIVALGASAVALLVKFIGY